MEKYKIDLNFKLSDDVWDSLVNLYSPVFSVPALSLFTTLYGIGFHHRDVTRRELLRLLHVDMHAFDALRIELERFNLLRTFVKEDSMVLVLQQPLRPQDFLSHPSYGRLYAIVMGTQAFLDAKTIYFKQALDTQGAHEVSASFDINRLASWGLEDESSFNTKHEHQSIGKNRFNALLFFQNLSQTYFPVSLRTHDVIELIEEMGSTYTMSHSDMKTHLLKATDRDSKVFDKTKFIVSIEKEFSLKRVGSVKDPYELDSISFLAYKQDNELIIDSDRRLIQNIMTKFLFDHKVMNVLIEYCLDTNNKNLSKPYVEKVAMQWKRHNVKTVEDARKVIANMSQSSYSKQPSTKGTQAVRVVEQPVYSNANSNVEDLDVHLAVIDEFLNKGGK